MDKLKLDNAPVFKMIDPDRVEACVRNAPLALLKALLESQRAGTAVELDAFGQNGFTISAPSLDGQERREFNVPVNCLL